MIMEIAVLYIATKRYVELWKGFHDTAEQFFLPEFKKRYFVFTDQPDFFSEKECVITKVEDDTEWFNVSLNRFDYFLLKEQELKEYDYVLFFNSDTIFRYEICPEGILPTLDNDNLIGCSMFKCSKTSKCYVDDASYACYIPLENRSEYYYIGSLIGGATSEFIKVCHDCSNMIREDKRKNLIPSTHDEAYYNKALSGKNPLLVDFASNDESLAPSILFRNKYRLFGQYISDLKKVKPLNRTTWKLFQKK